MASQSNTACSLARKLCGAESSRLNRAVAEQELARAQQELAAQQQRVLTDVRIAFYKTLLAQRQIDMTANLVRTTTQGADVVDKLIKAKEATRLDVLQSQLEVETAQILAKNARNAHDAAWRELSTVIGDPYPTGAAPDWRCLRPALRNRI